MPSVQKIRFTIDVDGAPRLLQSIKELANGDLVLIIKSARYDRPDSNMHSAGGPEIRQHRYSVHMSPRSSDFNLLKMTERLSNGSLFSLAILTDAVKRKTGFALLHARRLQSLANDRYRLTSPADVEISLGRYDPRHFNLIYAIFVGAPDREFRIYSVWDINLAEYAFRNFRVVILWSFMSAPSFATGDFLYNMTFPPEQAEDEAMAKYLDARMRGIDERKALELFYAFRSQFAEHYVTSTEEHAPDLIDEHKILRALVAHFRHGILGADEEHRQLARRLELSGGLEALLRQ